LLAGVPRALSNHARQRNPGEEPAGGSRRGRENANQAVQAAGIRRQRGAGRSIERRQIGATKSGRIQAGRTVRPQETKSRQRAGGSGGGSGE